MKLFGWLLFVGGLLLAVVSFLVPNTVDTPQTTYLASIGETITTGTAAVFNLAKAQLQIMILHAGCAAFVAGAILIGAGTVAEQFDAAKGPAPGVGPELVAQLPVGEQAAVDRSTLTPEEAEAQHRKTRNDMLMVIGGVVAVILVVLVLAAIQPSPSQRAASAPTENTADGLAAKIEAEASKLNGDGTEPNSAGNPFDDASAYK